MKNKKIDLKRIIKEAVEETNHPFCDEEDFRIAVVNKLQEELKQEKPLIITEYKFNNKNAETGRIDIFLYFNRKGYAIELKYRPNCTLSNKETRDGTIKLQGKNKSITVNWLIDKLNKHKNEISVSKNNNEYGAIITWKNKNQEKKYYIMTQNLAYECIDDINKLQEYIINIDQKVIGYAVVLSDHEWPIINNHIDLEAAQKNGKQKTIHHIINKSDINIKQNKMDISINTPHQGYWLEIAEIKNK